MAPDSNVDPSPNIDTGPPLQLPTLDAYGGPLQQQQMQMPSGIGGGALQQQQMQMPSGIGGGAQNAPGAGEMNAAYKVSSSYTL